MWEFSTTAKWLQNSKHKTIPRAESAASNLLDEWKTIVKTIQLSRSFQKYCVTARLKVCDTYVCDTGRYILNLNCIVYTSHNGFVKCFIDRTSHHVVLYANCLGIFPHISHFDLESQAHTQRDTPFVTTCKSTSFSSVSIFMCNHSISF